MTFDHAAYCAEISKRMAEYAEHENKRALAEVKAKEDIAASNAAYVFRAGMVAATLPDLAENISRLDAA